jgi:magnesium chelatase family protein
VEVPAVPHSDLTKIKASEPSAVIAARVEKARDIQTRRFARTKIHSNARMGSRHIKAHCRIDADSRRLLQTAIDKLGLSARAYHRVLKIARTIADLAGSSQIGTDHISEAIQYRNLDRACNRAY